MRSAKSFLGVIEIFCLINELQLVSIVGPTSINGDWDRGPDSDKVRSGSEADPDLPRSGDPTLEGKRLRLLRGA